MDVSENSGFSPQIIHFNRVFHYKPSILGETPLFLETPKCPKFKLARPRNVTNFSNRSFVMSYSFSRLEWPSRWNLNQKSHSQRVSSLVWLGVYPRFGNANLKNKKFESNFSWSLLVPFSLHRCSYTFFLQFQAAGRSRSTSLWKQATNGRLDGPAVIYQATISFPSSLRPRAGGRWGGC